MATVVNDRDVLIMSATPRYSLPNDRGMFLTPPNAVFKMDANGLTASPSSFTFTVTLLNMTGAVSWSWTGGMSLSVNGNTATLDLANFSAVSGTVTATITVDGQVWAATATVTKLADGARGPQGVRGNVDISAVTSSSAWSDSEAAAALNAAGYGLPQIRDIVNLYKADRTFSAQKMYNGSAWVTVDYVWNGNVFVKGSILPEAIDTRGLTIKDAQGNVILGAGTGLDWGNVIGTGKPADNATSDIALVGRGIAVSGNNLTKAAGVSGFDSDAYSTYGYTGGAFASAVAVDNTHAIMFGLNTDQTADSNFTSIDYAMYLRSDGALWSYQNGGSSKVISNSYAAGDVLMVTYDGVNVRWLKNGIVLQTVTPASPITAPLYFDSSFSHVGGKLSGVRFGPLSSSNWNDVGGAGKPQDNATVGATIGSNLYGQMTAANISTYIAAAAIQLALIDKASIGSLSALSAVIGLLRTASSGQRSELSDNGLQLFNSANVPVVQVGFF